MNLEVTSVARHEQKLSETPSAVYVITQDDIRRSGATSIPEALRMAPGVHVARIDASKWAVGIRGFSSRFSDKLLVLVDGRSIYTPLFSGVLWESQDILLEDIDRIEVIRGPGAVMWGSNAVNGVINIITKTARDTQGLLLSGVGGNQEGGLGSLRYGARIDPRTHLRVYSKYSGRGGFLEEDGSRAPDDWRVLRGGVRLDWQGPGQDRFLFSAESHEGEAGGATNIPTAEFPFQQIVNDEASFSGSHALGRWTHELSDRSQTEFRTYFDRYERSDVTLEKQRVNTFDFDFQHQIETSSRNQLMWGVGYRLYQDRFVNSFTTSFHPDRRNVQLFSSFLQDEMWLSRDRLLLTAGVRAEHNSYTDWEIQPAASLFWRRGARDGAWLSAARAVRIPSRVNRDMRANIQGFPNSEGSPLLIAVLGDPASLAERLTAFEGGYRVQPSRAVSFDLAVFYNDYDRLLNTRMGEPFVDRSLGHQPLVLPQIQQNQRTAESYGVEAVSTWHVSSAWRLSLVYSQLHMSTTDRLEGGVERELPEVNSPPHQVHARSYLDLPGELEFDSAYFFVDSLTGVPSYHRVDARFGWKPQSTVELSVGLQNLLDDRHPEIVPLGFQRRSEVGRSVYGEITWRFK